jgi:hypothetical protein
VQGRQIIAGMKGKGRLKRRREGVIGGRGCQVAGRKKKGFGEGLVVDVLWRKPKEGDIRKDGGARFGRGRASN